MRAAWRRVMPAGAISRTTADGAYVKVTRAWNGGYRVTVYRYLDTLGIAGQTASHHFPRVTSHRLDRP